MVRPASKPRPRGRPPRAPQESEARRQAILDAALVEFAAHGFAAARLDDVARRAGIAKGTLYLYFADKEALFEALVRGAIKPLLDNLQQVAALPDVPTRQVLKLLFSTFAREVLGSDRKLLLRLLITEGGRFPRLVAFYHAEIVTPGLALMHALMTRAAERGEIASDAPARFPQLVMAPLLLAIVWDMLFGRVAPLDTEGLIDAHVALLMDEGRATP
ncbi:MAG: TetR/AcrR family transcriptional regulator [Reyranellaceae bacterium]